MGEPKSSLLEDAVMASTDWVNRVLTGGLILSGVVVLLKLTGKSQFKWADVEFSLSSAWMVFALFTLAHFYTALLLLRSTHRLWRDGTPESKARTFDKVSATGGLFVRGMLPSVDLRKIVWVQGINPHDPSTWLTRAASILLLLAIVPFAKVASLSFLLYAFVAVLIMSVNWLIGSLWLVSIAELADDRIGGPRLHDAIHSQQYRGLAQYLIEQFARFGVAMLAPGFMFAGLPGRYIRSLREASFLRRTPHRFINDVCQGCGCSRGYILHRRLLTCKEHNLTR